LPRERLEELAILAIGLRERALADANAVKYRYLAAAGEVIED